MPPSEPFPIMVVEDSDDDLFLFRRLLAKAGIKNPLSIATNGQAAIDLLAVQLSAGTANGLPRIIFLDLKLPLRSGFEVLEWIRAQSALQCAAVVVLSSSAEARDVKRAYELGAHGYLVKYPVAAVFQEVIRLIGSIAPDSPVETLSLPGITRP